MDMDLDRICQNCSSFFIDSEESEPGWGVCMNNSDFELYIDDIIEESSFATCYNLYKSKRYDGERDACDEYEEVEIVGFDDSETEFDPDKHIDMLRNQDVKDIVDVLYESDTERQTRAVRSLDIYIRVGNEGAYRGLLDYYKQLPMAVDLKDVHYRILIVELLSHKLRQEETQKEIIDAFVHELARTPSNKTTRQLYALIIRELGRCERELIEAPIEELLKLRNYSYKMKNNIMELLSDRDDDWGGFWSL